MRVPNWKTCAGYLCAIAALALSLPGVKAVRADEEAVGVVSVGLVDSTSACDAAREPAARTQATVFLEFTPDRSDAPHPIALNTQGYSYHVPAVDPEARRRLERH